MDLIKFDVSGKLLKVYRKTIYQRDSILRDLISDEITTIDNEIFIDENQVIFDAIIDYHRSGIISKPPIISDELWENRIRYWGIKKLEVKNDDFKYAEYFLQGIIRYTDRKYEFNSDIFYFDKLKDIGIEFRFYDCKSEDIGFYGFTLPIGANDDKILVIFPSLSHPITDNTHPIVVSKEIFGNHFKISHDFRTIQLWMCRSPYNRDQNLESYIFKKENII